MIRDKGTYKAKQIRKQRQFCKKYSGLSRKSPYSIISQWEEENVGTEDLEFKITLKQGFSFDREGHVPVGRFSSVNEALIAVRNCFVCSCPMCVQPSK